MRFKSNYSGAIRNPSASLTTIMCNLEREDGLSEVFLQHLSAVGHKLPWQGKAGIPGANAAWQYHCVDLGVRPH